MLESSMEKALRCKINHTKKHLYQCYTNIVSSLQKYGQAYYLQNADTFEKLDKNTHNIVPRFVHPDQLESLIQPYVTECNASRPEECVGIQVQLIGYRQLFTLYDDLCTQYGKMDLRKNKLEQFQKN